MKISKEKTIGEVATYNYITASVFEKFGINFYCRGNDTIENVCSIKNMNPEILIEELNDVIKTIDKAPAPNYNSWPIVLLIDHIEKKHHSYIKEKIPTIQQYLYKLCREEGPLHTEVLEINEQFSDLVPKLETHVKREVHTVFFFIRRIESAKMRNIAITIPPLDSIKNLIEPMMQQHNEESERFRKISQLSNNYNSPHNSSNNYKTAFTLLKEFEKNLYLYFHLENNILFPKVMKMVQNPNM